MFKYFLLSFVLLLVVNFNDLTAKQSGSNKIVFLSTRDGNTQVYIMNKDGSNVKRITKSPEKKYWPRISPDGKKIVFTNEESKLIICDIDGSNQSIISKSSENCFTPSWSHDNKKILFSSTRGGYTDSDGDPVSNIWIMNIDGTNAIQLTFTNFTDKIPVLSPDGKSILFTSSRDKIYFEMIDKTYIAYRRQIYIMKADGSDQTRLTALNPGLKYNSPVFTPDGKKIIYSMEFTMSSNNKWSHIYIMNVDGSHPIRLSAMNANHTYPYCSPDGKKIIFDADVNEHSPIMQMNIDGSNVLQLSKDSYYNFLPSYF